MTERLRVRVYSLGEAWELVEAEGIIPEEISGQLDQQDVIGVREIQGQGFELLRAPVAPSLPIRPSARRGVGEVVHGIASHLHF
jgi:hypothetical protein